MKIIQIEDPTNVIYPLDREILKNPYIVYDGTNSNYKDKIEREGWKN